MASYCVEEILDKRIVDGKGEYHIKWLGYSSEDNTWEPEKHLNPSLVAKFEETLKNHKKLSANEYLQAKVNPPTQLKGILKRNTAWTHNQLKGILKRNAPWKVGINQLKNILQMRTEENTVINEQMKLPKRVRFLQPMAYKFDNESMAEQFELNS